MEETTAGPTDITHQVSEQAALQLAGPFPEITLALPAELEQTIVALSTEAQKAGETYAHSLRERLLQVGTLGRTLSVLWCRSEAMWVLASQPSPSLVGSLGQPFSCG